MAVGGFTANPIRLPVIDYLTVPAQLYSVSMTFATSPPQQSNTVGSHWNGFLDPLDWTTWLALLFFSPLFMLAAKIVFGIKLKRVAFEVFLFILKSLTAMGNFERHISASQMDSHVH
jgi:hypothetical protein